MSQPTQIERLLALTEELIAENDRLKAEAIILHSRLRDEIIQSAKESLKRELKREKKGRRKDG